LVWQREGLWIGMTEHISIVPAADDDGIRQRKEFPGQVPEGGKAEHDEERRRTAVPDLAQAPRRRWRARGCWRARAHNAQPPNHRALQPGASGEVRAKGEGRAMRANGTEFAEGVSLTQS
jgi:hypothetical protein